MDPDKAAENIIVLLQVIRARQSPHECHPLFAPIYQTIRVLEKRFPEIARQIQEKINDMGLATDMQAIIKYADECTALLGAAPKLQQQQGYLQRYFDLRRVDKTREYFKDCETHANLRDDITKKEIEITTAPCYNRKLHGFLGRSLHYSGMLHARLTKNLRIVYTYDRKEKVLTFIRIVDHDELERKT